MIGKRSGLFGDIIDRVQPGVKADVPALWQLRD